MSPLHILNIGEDLCAEFERRRGARSPRTFLRALLSHQCPPASPAAAVSAPPATPRAMADSLLADNRALIEQNARLEKENIKLKKKLQKVIDE